MATFKPGMPVRSNRTIILNRGNTFEYVYSLRGTARFPEYTTTATLEFHNTYGQLVGLLYGTVEDLRTIRFLEEHTHTADFDNTTSWRLFVEIGGYPRLIEQGNVVRDEAPWPDQPPQSSGFDGVRYAYSFEEPGRLLDNSWVLKNGQPWVYDNSLRDLPNAVAAGGALFDDVAMLWWAPLRADPVRLTYNTIRASDNSNGEMWTVVCSDSNMSNWAGFRHKQVWGIGAWDDDTIEIVTGTSPVSMDVRESEEYDTVDNQDYTAEYNPISDSYSLYVGASLEPLITWQDATGIVNHGEGERYVGFGFRSSALQAGVQCSDWSIADTP